MLRGIHLVQVLDVHPLEYAVSVLLPNLTTTTGAKIRLPEEEFALVAPGKFGIVAFYAEDRRSGVWLRTLPDTATNLIPHELLQEDPRATLKQHPNGAYSLRRSNGDEEHVLPDGSLLKIACSSRNNSRTPRKRTRRKGDLFGQTERVDWTPPEREPADVYLELASGLNIHINGSGEVSISNGNITLRMEQNRFVLDGDVELAGGTQAVARENDPVEVTIPAGVLAIPGGQPLPAPLTVTGQIRPRPGGRVKAG
ncbi:MAG: hypothetical protein N2318_10970 [Meiothermus sp.]|nr:hypothetical protein [Meiothermus sp.]